MAAPSRTGVTSAVEFDVAELAVARPAGASSGEATLIAVVGWEVGPTPPPGRGLVELATGDDGEDALHWWLGWRTDDGETGDLVFDAGTPLDVMWGLAISFAGTDPITPFLVGAVGHGAGLSWTAPSLTTGRADSLLELIGVYNYFVDSVAFPPGWTTVLDEEEAWQVGETVQVAAGPTGNQTIDVTSPYNTQWAAFLVAVQPPATAAGAGLWLRQAGQGEQWPLLQRVSGQAVEVPVQVAGA